MQESKLARKFNKKAETLWFEEKNYALEMKFPAYVCFKNC
jgi:hypothetical protein